VSKQTVDIRQMAADLNVMLQQVDARFAAAKRAFGVKPNLTVAKDRIADAGASVMETASLVQELQEIGISQPPDIIEKLRERYRALHQMALDVEECEKIVFVRSHSERPQNTLN
jgi:predicted DNA-binding protein (UPF0278 family)